jgi:hypothetical protein
MRKVVSLLAVAGFGITVAGVYTATAASIAPISSQFALIVPVGSGCGLGVRRGPFFDCTPVHVYGGSYSGYHRAHVRSYKRGYFRGYRSGYYRGYRDAYYGYDSGFPETYYQNNGFALENLANCILGPTSSVCGCRWGLCY